MFNEVHSAQRAKGRLSRLEKQLLAKPWQEARPGNAPLVGLLPTRVRGHLRRLRHSATGPSFAGDVTVMLAASRGKRSIGRDRANAKGRVRSPGEGSPRSAGAISHFRYTRVGPACSTRPAAVWSFLCCSPPAIRRRSPVSCSSRNAGSCDRC
jgi:hypothetical protein